MIQNVAEVIYIKNRGLVDFSIQHNSEKKKFEVINRIIEKDATPVENLAIAINCAEFFFPIYGEYVILWNN